MPTTLPPLDGDSVYIRPWADEVIDQVGFDPRTPYVERFWLGILGPSTVWLLRRGGGGAGGGAGGWRVSSRRRRPGSSCRWPTPPAPSGWAPPGPTRRSCGRCAAAASSTWL